MLLSEVEAINFLWGITPQINNMPDRQTPPNIWIGDLKELDQDSSQIIETSYASGPRYLIGVGFLRMMLLRGVKTWGVPMGGHFAG